MVFLSLEEINQLIVSHMSLVISLDSNCNIVSHKKFYYSKMLIKSVTLCAYMHFFNSVVIAHANTAIA